MFGVHTWKDGPRTVKKWIEYHDAYLGKYKILEDRLETPEEYHNRKKNKVTVLFLGKLHTFTMSWRN